MTNQLRTNIIQYLGLLGFEPSKIVVGGHLGRYYFFYEGHEIASTFLKLGASDSEVKFVLPPRYRSLKTFAPFSQNVTNGYNVESLTYVYKLDKHSELKEMLKELQNKRIPKEKLWTNTEHDNHYGVVRYTFGIPQEDRLCIRVDRTERLKELVPEAEEQPDQDHACIHGETAPFMSLNPFEFKRIIMGLKTVGNEGSRYLQETLEGVPLPADGLDLIVHRDNNKLGEIVSGIIRPYSNPVFVITVYEPEKKENWDNIVTLARRVEEIFKK